MSHSEICLQLLREPGTIFSPTKWFYYKGEKYYRTKCVSGITWVYVSDRNTVTISLHSLHKMPGQFLHRCVANSWNSINWPHFLDVDGVRFELTTAAQKETVYASTRSMIKLRLFMTGSTLHFHYRNT